MSTGRTLVRFLRIRQVVLAVDPDTYLSLIEQGCEFCELRTTRADLGGRDRDSELFSLFGAVESQAENGKQRSATLERAKEASRGRTANRVYNQIDVADGVFRLALGVELPKRVTILSNVRPFSDAKRLRRLPRRPTA